MNTPNVSIILPVYNVEPWLAETLTSLQNQTLKDWEAIFVVDGSPDNSEKILKEYEQQDPRIKVLVQENKGQGAARDFGVENAKGQYLLFLDPDDLLAVDALDKAYQRAVETDADIVVGDYIPFKDGEPCDPKSAKSGYAFNEYFAAFKDRTFTREDITDDNFFYNGMYFMVVWMKLFKRESWLKFNIRAPEGLTMGEDFMTVKKMTFLSERIATVDSVLVYYRRREGSATTLRSEKAFGIFDSYYFTKRLYNDLALSVRERSLMHGAYLDWFYSHLVHFTPLKLSWKFYLGIQKTVNDFDLSELDASVLGRQRLTIIKILKLPKLIGLPVYVFINYFYPKKLHNRIIVAILLFIKKCLPKSVFDKFISFLNSLIQKNKLQRFHPVIKKVIFHLSRN